MHKEQTMLMEDRTIFLFAKYSFLHGNWRVCMVMVYVMGRVHVVGHLKMRFLEKSFCIYRGHV